MNKRFLILLTLALAALLLMSGCDAAPANETTADTDPPYIMDGQTILSDKIPFTMSLVQTTLTEADTFITVAITLIIEKFSKFNFKFFIRESFDFKSHFFGCHTVLCE